MSKSVNKPTCYKCGKYGHYKRDCPLLKRIRALEIKDEEREDILNLLRTSSEE